MHLSRVNLELLSDVKMCLVVSLHSEHDGVEGDILPFAWQFTAMPFNLKIAPLVFTWIVKASISDLRIRLKINVVAYLDGLLVPGTSQDC